MRVERFYTDFTWPLDHSGYHRVGRNETQHGVVTYRAAYFTSFRSFCYLQIFRALRDRPLESSEAVASVGRCLNLGIRGSRIRAMDSCFLGLIVASIFRPCKERIQRSNNTNPRGLPG